MSNWACNVILTHALYRRNTSKSRISAVVGCCIHRIVAVSDDRGSADAAVLLLVGMHER